MSDFRGTANETECVTARAAEALDGVVKHLTLNTEKLITSTENDEM